MSCTNPLLAVRIFKDDLGKNIIKLLPKNHPFLIERYVNRYGRENLLELPCGHCLSCLSKRSKEWSVRCALEALDHDKNCFVTLTYDEVEYLKRDIRKDWKIFIKSLRNRGYKIRYFGCCEKGEKYGRHHFHIILFGFFPEDCKPWAKAEKGSMMYSSDIVTNCWKKGLVTVQEFSPYAANYVAGYVLKKFALSEEDSFHFQSTRPGIGAGYVLRNMEEIYFDDKLILNFGKHVFGVPRYFDKLAANCALDLDDVKAKRLDASSKITNKEMRDHNLKSFEELWDYRAGVMKSQYKHRKRSF